jgi:hypothetical protein
VECPRIAQKHAPSFRLTPKGGTAHFSMGTGTFPATRRQKLDTAPKTWSQSRRLVYTTRSRHAKMEIPA